MSKWKHLWRKNNSKTAVSDRLKDSHLFKDSGLTKLHIATCNDDLDRIKYCLNNDSNVNCTTKLGYTPLHYAASNGLDKAAKLLVEIEGVDVERRNIANMTPLHLAAISNNAKVLEVLLTKIEHVNSRGFSEKTALHCAAQEGSLEAAKILLAKQADVEAKDDRNRSALHYAAEQGFEDMCILLVQYNAIVHSYDKNEMTPLYIAIKKNQRKVIEALMSASPNINASSNNTSALHIAAQYGDFKTVKLMLDKGANIEFRDRYGQLAVDLAKTRADPESAVKIVRLLESTKLLLDTVDSTISKLTPLVKDLISRGACVNATNNSSQSPLFIAIQKGKIALIKLLLARGADHEWSTSRGTTALHRACELNDLRIVRLLLERNKKCQPDLKKRAEFLDSRSSHAFGRSALHIAAKNGNQPIVLLLLKYGSMHDALDDNQEKPLAVAAKSVVPVLDKVGDLFRHIESADERSAIECLNEYPAIVNAREASSGATPLVSAMKHKRPRLCQFILNKAIADLDLLTLEGNTPLHVASMEGDCQIVRSLLRHKQGKNFINAQTTTNLQAPLHLASTLEIATVLLRSGARYDLRDQLGRTPDQVVRNEEVRQLLQCLDDLFHCTRTQMQLDQYPKKVFLHAVNSEGKRVPWNQNGENPNIFGKLDYLRRLPHMMSPDHRNKRSSLSR